ncbi:hypothetical protein ACHAWF_005270 [Thalassiosira exigua]
MVRVGVLSRVRVFYRQRRTAPPKLAAAVQNVQTSSDFTSCGNREVDRTHSTYAWYATRVLANESCCAEFAKRAFGIRSKYVLPHALDGLQTRAFQTVRQYHDAADEALHSVQDVVEDFLEKCFGDAENDDDIPEVNYADGVLTIYLPPHGTWVINKQTPNQQIWWSSPISGPRRYEYDEGRERWVFSRVISEDGTSHVQATIDEADTLGEILNQEFIDLFGEGLGDFHC